MHGKSRSGGWRLALIMVLAFAVSAGLTAFVSGAVTGDSGSYVGDDRDNIAVGGTSEDSMSGAAGDDYFRGQGGADTLSGGDGGDTLIGDEGAPGASDSAQGDAGDDEIAGGPGDDALGGGDGDDLIGSIDFATVGLPNIVEDGNDTIDGAAGNDVLLAGPGNDSVAGGPDEDTIDGGADGDTVDGGPGADSIAGGDGNDTLRDREAAGAGDVLSGNAGDDTFEVRNGLPDTVSCGAGTDTVVTESADTVAEDCESVQLPAEAGNPAGGDGGDGGTGPGPVDPAVPDTVAPDTRIDSAPAKKITTRSKSKRVTFGFSATEAGSTFACGLDDKAFAPCTSPARYELKRGKHTFSVRATDAAGNTDRTPAQAAVTIAKKKRKKG